MLPMNGHICVDWYNFQINAQGDYYKTLLPFSSENQLNAQGAVTGKSKYVYKTQLNAA